MQRILSRRFLEMIQFDQVTKRYASGFEALSQVNFTLDKGEMVFLTGHSGAGKSTLLNLVALIDRPTSGQIIVNGNNLATIKSSNAIALHRQNLGIALQTPNLLNDRSVFDNVALPLIIKDQPKSMQNKRVHAALDMVGLLKKQTYLPKQLSSGEQQRIGLARAMVHKPLLLLADEPTGNLDPTLSIEIIRLLEQFNQYGVSILVATHDLTMIAGLKHRIVCLKGGKLC